MQSGATRRETPTRGPAPSGSAEYERALDVVCSGIRDPVAKLRFIRTSLAHFDELRRRVGWVPFAALRRALYVWLSLERFRTVLERGRLSPFARRRLRRSLVVGRLIAISAGLMATVLAAGLGVAVLVVIPQTYARIATPSDSPAPAVEPELSPPVGWSRAAPPVAPTPAGIWLVEEGESWEQYSNGLRIETKGAVKGEPRRFRVFDAEEGMLPEVHTAPVGILFHTSESDIWPLEEAFNENLRDSSHRLLRYLRRKTVYNYLIDRFGRVYRVIDDASKVNHAGYSIWAHKGRYYLSLNNAFLGVCFETRWEGGVAMPITAAQFAAGKNLTDCLRYRFGIAPEMCVGHGLASVNGRRHLIGHHVDWARGFPFQAYGLPNQYVVPPASMAFFGFWYDEDFLERMGEPWPGVRTAERQQIAGAARAGVSIEEWRQRRQAIYDEWIAEQSRDDEGAPSKRAQRHPAHGRQGG